MAHRLLVLLAAIFAVAFATVEPHAAASSTVEDMAGTPRALPGTHLQIDGGFGCPVRNGSVVGACPRPLVSGGRQPRLRPCGSLRYVPYIDAWRMEPAICGSGFHSDGLIVIVLRGRTGEVAWRVAADAGGAFRTALPWPLCSVAPGRVVAVDLQAAESNPVPLPRVRCH